MARRMTVVRHAVDQLQARRLDDRSYEELEKHIREEVADALENGRLSDRKPQAFRLYREKRKGKMFHTRDRCVWNKDMSLAWVVRRHDDHDVVLTTLTRAMALKEKS